MIVLYWLVVVHHVYHKILILDLTAVGVVMSVETGVIVIVLSLVQETVLNQTLLALTLRPVLLLEEQ